MTEPTWRSSTRSAQTECVEVALRAHTIGVRDSKEPQHAHLTIPAARWHSFLARLKTGRYDQPGPQP